MKVSPVREYPAPRYPRAVEAAREPALLRAVPARWAAGSRLAVLLGAGMAAPALLAGKTLAADAPAPAGQSGEAAPKAGEGRVRRNNAGDLLLKVAPLLEEALRKDGRGAFGCVVVDPPTFLSEEEAVGIIRRELAAAGLKLADKGPTLPNVTRPVTDLDRFEAEEAGRIPRSHEPAPFEFDGGSDDATVVFEYISRQDYQAWHKVAPRRQPDGTVVFWYSSVSSYNFADAAARFAAGLYGLSTGGGCTVGVFFDPMGRAQPVQAGRSYPRTQEERTKHAADSKAAAEARLKLQVDAFVKFLRREGRLPKEPPAGKAPGPEKAGAPAPAPPKP